MHIRVKLESIENSRDKLLISAKVLREQSGCTSFEREVAKRAVLGNAENVFMVTLFCVDECPVPVAACTSDAPAE